MSEGSNGDTSRLSECSYKQISLLLAINKHTIVTTMYSDLDGVRDDNIVISCERTNSGCGWGERQNLRMVLILNVHKRNVRYYAGCGCSGFFLSLRIQRSTYTCIAIQQHVGSANSEETALPKLMDMIW